MNADGVTARSRAFTLIELVISAALMSVILGAAYACLRAGVLGRELIEVRSDIAQNARVAMTLMTDDLRAASPLSRANEFLGMDRMMGEAEADNLDFATLNYSPRAPHDGDFCEVSYFLNQDPEAPTYTLWRRRDPTLDDEPLAGGALEEIARGLTGLTFEYYDGFEWFDEWGDPDGQRRAQMTEGQDTSLLPSNLSGLPDAVRITLRFAAEPKKKPDRAPAATEKKAAEPELVFQTVVRLDLAPASMFNRSSESGTTGAEATPTTSGQPSPGGAAAGAPGQ